MFGFIFWIYAASAFAADRTYSCEQLLVGDYRIGPALRGELRKSPPSERMEVQVEGTVPYEQRDEYFGSVDKSGFHIAVNREVMRPSDSRKLISFSWTLTGNANAFGTLLGSDTEISYAFLTREPRLYNGLIEQLECAAPSAIITVSIDTTRPDALAVARKSNLTILSEGLNLGELGGNGYSGLEVRGSREQLRSFLQSFDAGTSVALQEVGFSIPRELWPRISQGLQSDIYHWKAGTNLVIELEVNGSFWEMEKAKLELEKHGFKILSVKHAEQDGAKVDMGMITAEVHEPNAVFEALQLIPQLLRANNVSHLLPIYSVVPFEVRKKVSRVLGADLQTLNGTADKTEMMLLPTVENESDFNVFQNTLAHSGITLSRSDYFPGNAFGVVQIAADFESALSVLARSDVLTAWSMTHEDIVTLSALKKVSSSIRRIVFSGSTVEQENISAVINVTRTANFEKFSDQLNAYIEQYGGAVYRKAKYKKGGVPYHQIFLEAPSSHSGILMVIADKTDVVTIDIVSKAVR